jgi:hypothetical protein
MRDWESGLDALEGGDGEFGALGEVFETGGGMETTTGRVFDEVEEMELAGALLEVTDEQELDQFLGNLIRRAGRVVGAAVRSPVGQALGGIVKDAARQALPVIGGAIGSAVGGQAGGTFGSQVATSAGQLFGLELEGLSPEDQQYEVARRVVRFAGAAAANAAQAPPTVSAPAVARNAAVAAAREHAPGMVGASGPGRLAIPGQAGPGRGRWVRRGRTIVIVNCNAPGPGPTA